MTDVLSRRGLNRATLARQLLLDRMPVRAIDAIEHLGGMQAQAPLAPYVGLWTRLRDFAPDELSALTEQRQVVRLHVMRNTVHLLSARDALDWRGLFSQLHAAHFDAHFRRGLDGVDRDALVELARRLLDERPRTRSELGRLLADRWPDAEPSALAYAATHLIALCQVPPRGVWGKQGPAAWAPVETWLGAPLRPHPANAQAPVDAPAPADGRALADGRASVDGRALADGRASVDGLVLRYLGAFGPASVADAQLWSGLTRLGEVVDRLPLRSFRGPDGQVLFDLPDAPRPAEDTPAPPRFLPEYDNLLLSHKDRTRVILDGRAVPLPPGSGATTGTFLIDGVWRGTWQSRGGTLRIEPFTELRATDSDALLAEAERLSAFLDRPQVELMRAARSG